jgi:formylglycine-generating enzyme
MVMSNRASLVLILLTVPLARSPITQALNMETVPVGNSGNVADTRYPSGGVSSFGGVAGDYRIGTYEVTAGQYAEFLNAVARTDTYGLYNTYMWSNTTYGCRIQQSGSSGNYSYSVASDDASRPVNYMSYWDACRFANWLHNGQPTGAQGATTTERGAYTLDGYNVAEGWPIQRNPGWKWAVTNEDEWYKAAYYKGGSTNAGYWDYPTSSSTAPGRDMADLSGNNANYSDYGGGPYAYPIDSGKYTTVVGEFQNSAAPCGTFDQGGNVWEWTEAVYGASYRVLRGGSFDEDYGGLHAYYRNNIYNYPTYEACNVGFRIVEAPEPATMVVLAMGGLVATYSRRRARRIR